MTKHLLLAGSVLLSVGLNAQVGINAGQKTDAPQYREIAKDAVLQIANKQGEHKGVLFPQMTTDERNTINNPSKGLMIFNTNYNCLQVFDGRDWGCTDGSHKEVAPGVPAIATLGNIAPLKWIALEYNSAYYNSPESTVPNNGSISVEIPYSNAANGDYSAYEQTFTLLDKNNTPRQFKLSYPAGTITQAKGTITATLTNISGGEYNPKAQQPDGQYNDLATVQVSLNGAGATPMKIQATGGILDRCFGKTTRQCVGYGADVLEHQFIYIPIQGPDGKTWLNNNLGADYANVNSSVFNPVQQAKTVDDYHAYGSYFQWQRKPDGHELMNWSSGSSAPTPKYSGTASRVGSWIANTNKFIPTDYTEWSWNYNYASGPFNLWQSGGANNPCPVGYHVPTKSEWEALDRAVRSDPASYYTVKYLHSSLRVPTAGLRRWDGTFYHQSSNGTYWSSDVDDSSGLDAWSLSFSSSKDSPGSGNAQADGFSVRCLQD